MLSIGGDKYHFYGVKYYLSIKEFLLLDNSVEAHDMTRTSHILKQNK